MTFEECIWRKFFEFSKALPCVPVISTGRRNLLFGFAITFILLEFHNVIQQNLIVTISQLVIQTVSVRLKNGS